MNDVEAAAVIARRLPEVIAAHRDGAPRRELRDRQFAAGLAWVWFPEGLGGLGAGPELQDVIDEGLAAAGVPPFEETSGIGIAMTAPTLIGHGTPAQQQRFVRRIFTGEDIWCQLFSEPGAGSDLAGLSTRAERDGDDWVLEGQKVWTSFANIADWALVLARHDPELPKHRGLTYFALDMHAPGIEIRPLREMTGDGQFSEVFLTGVRIPDEQRVGAVGDGWRVALGTLSDERAGRGVPLGAGAIDHALRIWREGERADRAHRDELLALYVRSRVNDLLAERAAATRGAGGSGAEGSVVKLAAAELGQQVYAFCLTLLGADGMLMPGGYGGAEVGRGERHLAGRSTEWMFLRSRGFTIEGGTAQIQRNVLGERILGLPGEPRDDRTVPWSAIPRG
jgi:alkylation response protein AidB-like acyl-CoA dehydrogenase